MKTNRMVLFILFLSNLAIAQEKNYIVRTIAFYNLENLFDTIDNPNTYDEDWTPRGKEIWNTKKYYQKLDNLDRVLSEIGNPTNPDSPVIIGCCEIENRDVLEDLVKRQRLSKKNYGIIHFDSPDRRGIDVALLYQKKHFQPISYLKAPLYIYSNSTKKKKIHKTENEEKIIGQNINEKYRIYTRDQLVVTGYLDGEEVSFIVNHWPSKSGGEKKSMPNRKAAAVLTRKLIDSLQRINADAKILVMGDFNDGATDASVKTLNNSMGNNSSTKHQLYNPFEKMSKTGIGTLAYRDVWSIFDQILLSQPLLNREDTKLRYWKAGIYNKSFLIQKEGRYKGYPLRHSSGEVGYSDHFPVYVYLIKPMSIRN